MTFVLSRRLLIAFLLLLLISLTACTKADSETNVEGDTNENTNDDEGIKIPDEDATEGDFTKFEDIVYVRPDTEALIAVLNATSEKIRRCDGSFEEQVAAIAEIEAAYSDFLTMNSYVTIISSRDATDEFYMSEYEALSAAYPEILQALENLLVAAAASEYAERFENEYFGEGLIAEYGEGGIYTEKMVELLKQEDELETKFISVTPASVEITYNGVTATYEEIEAQIAARYGRSSVAYERAILECEELYFEASTKVIIPIFVELVRVRRLIADELGYESYATYAYKTLYHDYDSELMDDFLDDIGKFVVPVYRDLYNTVFYSYFYSENPPHLSKGRLMNLLHETYAEADEDLYEIYSYMLAGGYYDVERSEPKRASGAFTIYLEDCSSPFVFMSTYGYVPDITTLSHEFGHFADAYINSNSTASLDLHEVSSQALELLTTEMVRTTLTTPEYKYLLYCNMENALLALIYQGFYAKFECEIYELEYNEITEERLSEIAAEVSTEMGLVEQDLSAVLIDHIMLYPFYVQSYCTSMVAALDIYFTECEQTGKGVEVYKDLITRDSDLSFIEELASVGIKSPFEKGRIKDIANKVYYKINGYYYYKLQGGYNAA